MSLFENLVISYSDLIIWEKTVPVVMNIDNKLYFCSVVIF